MKIKSNIKDICEKKGVKQVEFIRRMDAFGVSRNTAVAVYNGATNVQLWTIAASAKAIGVSLDRAIVME